MIMQEFLLDIFVDEIVNKATVSHKILFHSLKSLFLVYNMLIGIKYLKYSIGTLCEADEKRRKKDT